MGAGATFEDLLAGRDGGLREERFVKQCEYFIRYWGPNDERSGAAFAAGLMGIMRAAYELGAAFAAMPVLPARGSQPGQGRLSMGGEAKKPATAPMPTPEEFEALMGATGFGEERKDFLRRIYAGLCDVGDRIKALEKDANHG